MRMPDTPTPMGLPGPLMLPDSRNARILNAAAWALEHLYYADHANAAIHMSQVRYSPIVFELAESLAELGATGEAIRAVLADRGRYPLDPGRIADDGKV